MKVGLDDYVIENGKDRLEDFIIETSDWKLSREINELSARYGILLDKGQVIEYETGNLYTGDTFANVIEAPRKLIVDASKGALHTPDTKRTRTISAPRYWVESKARPETAWTRWA
jgi:hypothetical protein